MATMPIQAKKWAKDRFAQLHPTASPNFQGGNSTQQSTLLQTQQQIIQQLLEAAQQHTTGTHLHQEEKKDDTPTDKLNMSATEISLTLRICGLEEDQVENLPTWLFAFDEKHQNNNTRTHLVAKLLE
eukprot:12051271-Ditylum_brightwellii.AAC.1